MSIQAILNQQYPSDLALLEPDPQSLREVIDVCRQQNDLDELLSYLDEGLLAELSEIPEFPDSPI